MTTSEQNVSNDQRQTWLFLCATCLVLVVLYAFTLQTTINGSSHDYLLDTGEIQVALNVWGTIHYTGYPHYTILSAAITQIFRILGFAPALSASLSSMVWSLLGTGCVFFIFKRLLKNDLVLTGLACLTLGVIETFWFHSIIAEVYSFSYFLISLQVLLALRLREQPQNHEWWLLVFIVGVSVAHHRILLFSGPALTLLLWPYWWPKLKHAPGRFLPASLLLFATPFLAYIYLPLRLWQGSAWVYGQPGTWSGFWTQFTGNEVTGGLIRLPRSVAELSTNFSYFQENLTHQLPWWGVALGLIGLAILTWHKPWVGGAFLVEIFGYLTFVFLFPRAVWIPAVVMPVFIWLLLGIAYLVHQVTDGRKQPLKIAGSLLLIPLAFYLFQTNKPFIDELVLDRSGEEMIESLEMISAGQGEEPLVAIPWGADFFAATYGDQVAGTLNHLELVDHRADFAKLMNDRGEILTPSKFQSFWSADWWVNRVGPSYFSMNTAEIVSITTLEDHYQQVAKQANFELGNGINIRASMVDVQEGQIELTVYWEAVRPIDTPYSVAVHLVKNYPLQAPADLLAQADSTHPVAGWSPTTSWQTGQITQDKYRLFIPPESSPTAIAMTMYSVNTAGEFENQNWYVISLESDS